MCVCMRVYECTGNRVTVDTMRALAEALPCLQHLSEFVGPRTDTDPFISLLRKCAKSR